MIKVGEMAPDFNLKDQNNQDVKLSDLRGKKVLISWHPLAFTGICTDQMRDLEREYDRIIEAGIGEVLGISVDAQPSKATWAKALNIEKVKLLADFEPKGQMSKDYDMWVDKMGASGRAIAVVDEEGKIAYTKVYELSHYPDIEETIEELKKL